jgi:hypothetical protein
MANDPEDTGALTKLKLSPLIFAIWLVASSPSWAGDQDERFVEFPGPSGKTQTYDLSTVQMIQPGRFTIIGTSIDNADVMKLELKVLDTLRTYCGRPDGKYPPPVDVFTLGPPDLPVESIEVKSDQRPVAGKTNPYKVVLLSYPYTRLGHSRQGKIEPDLGYLVCKQASETESELYEEHRSSIMNGFRSKELFDCKRGLAGVFHRDEDDPAKATTYVVRPDTYAYRYYLGVCRRVMHELPYLPE